MALNDVIAKLLEFLGLKKSESDKYEAMDRKLRSSRASNVDRLEGLKEEIAKLTRQVKAKKTEYDAATGDTRRIVKGEIERLFGELDRIRGRETIIGRNISQLDLAVAKLAELRDAKAQGVEPEALDEIAVELEDIFKELKETDRAKNALDEVRYEPQKSATMDIDARVAELEGVDKATETSSAELSDSTRQRLKELAGEDE